MTAPLRVLLDTNVIRDVLLQRGQWLAEAQHIWQASRGGQLQASITASSLTDIYYICRRLVGASATRPIVRACLDTLTVLSVDAPTLEDAYTLGLPDYEDAVQIAGAVRHGLDAIITRDQAGFTGSPIPVLAPADLVARLQPAGPNP